MKSSGLVKLQTPALVVSAQGQVRRLIPSSVALFAQNQPLFPIREPTTFTHLTVKKEKSKKHRVQETRDGQTSCPKLEIAHYPCQTGNDFSKGGGTSAAIQDVRAEYLISKPVGFSRPPGAILDFGAGTCHVELSIQ